MTLALDSARGGQVADPLPLRQRGVHKQAGRPLRCKACGRAITDERERIVVGGAHEHTRTNPHGMRFALGCFARAPGGSETGKATEAFTWFAGYAWRVLLCGGCAVHLGWGFHGTGAAHFCGLVLNRLARPQ